LDLYTPQRSYRQKMFRVGVDCNDLHCRRITGSSTLWQRYSRTYLCLFFILAYAFYR
jgi:hypothetical protein